MLWSIVLLATQVPPGASDAAVDRMVALYEEVCLKAFPDDKAVDAVMAAKGATALTPEQVRITFNDDPGRGWLLADGDRQIQIMLELPPFHACSVRRTTPDGFGDLKGYRAVIEPYERAHLGFSQGGSYDKDDGDVHIHATGETRPLPDGRHETLLLFDQHVTDPKRRANGETAVDIRFVHQIVSADAH